jgi:hypothetical protein
LVRHRREARFQAIDDFRFEAAHVIRRFISQATMKLLGQANADHPTPGVFHPRKASDGRSKRDPDNQSGHSRKGDGHGDTTSNRTKRTIAMGPLAAKANNRTAATSTVGAPSSAGFYVLPVSC